MQTLPQRLLQNAPVAGHSAPEFWRSLEEFAGEASFQNALADEFPHGSSLWSSGPLGRRKFLKLLGASLALAGMTGCAKRTHEKIMPYVRQPEYLLPGKPLHFASAMPFLGFARGILVESHMGRPTKIEGNPEHPYSLGATDAITQAAILGLYDPDRLHTPVRSGIPATWRRFEAEWHELASKAKNDGGARIGLLYEPTSSPTLARQLVALLERFPNLQLYGHNPLETPIDAHSLRPLYDFSRAKVILSIESEALDGQADSLRYARQFAAQRRTGSLDTESMPRLYAAESAFTLTGSMADSREPAPPSELIELLHRVHRQIGDDSIPQRRDRHSEFVERATNDLREQAGNSLVIVGHHLPIEFHRIAYSINEMLGNLGRALKYAENPFGALPATQDLAALTEAVAAESFDAFLVLSGNPVYSAPADLKILEALQSLPWTAHLSLEIDETSEQCLWQLPQAHFLETWSDLRACNGLASIQQPLIEPLYQGRSPHQVLEMMLGQQQNPALDPVIKTWRHAYSGPDFTTHWESALQQGFVPDTEATPNIPGSNPYGSGGGTMYPPASDRTLWALFRPDSRVADGRWFSNAWLQELPKDLTHLVWDNAALIAPATAESLALENGDVVRLTLNGGSVEAPVWILPGHDASCITLPLGYGRRFGGDDGDFLGFNAYSIRRTDTLWNVPGLALEKTGRKYQLVTTQAHHAMHGRHLAMQVDLQEYKRDPETIQKKLHSPPPGESLYPKWPQGDYAWGMTIDLSACTGCQSCVAACQAENNIPVVGKEQAALGREMHWIRVDRYFKGSIENPETLHQPVPCMHCENAPCEVVCPVAATVHGNGGLNEMVYNRCVGTRYCSNNCPYKVRRFNFLDYRKDLQREHPVRDLKNNPDVTVRMRGVMEKCTFCVQRINTARIAAKKELRRIRDGEVVPACAQACPSEAILFGDISDSTTDVSKSKGSPLNYSLLAELNTRPRVTYLAKLKNREVSS